MIPLRFTLTGSNLIFQSLHFAALLDQDHAIVARAIDTNAFEINSVVTNENNKLSEAYYLPSRSLGIQAFEDP